MAFPRLPWNRTDGPRLLRVIQPTSHMRGSAVLSTRIRWPGLPVHENRTTSSESPPAPCEPPSDAPGSSWHSRRSSETLAHTDERTVAAMTPGPGQQQWKQRRRHLNITVDVSGPPSPALRTSHGLSFPTDCPRAVTNLPAQHHPQRASVLSHGVGKL